MTPNVAAAGAGAAAATGPGSSEPASPRVIDAARQFEALLVAQLLRAARAGAEGWLGTGEDHSSASAMELAEEQFAAALASQGGLGLARLIVAGLQQR